MPEPEGSPNPVGTVYDDYCPYGCCESENCKRSHDVLGEIVNPQEDYMLVFGGIALRNVTVDGEYLYNNCTKENKLKAQDSGVSLDFVSSCGTVLLNEIWRFNIHTKEWSYVKPTYNKFIDTTYNFPYPRYGHGAVYAEIVAKDSYTSQFVLRKYMYVYGGFALQCADACDDFWRFEIPWAAQRYYPEPEGTYWNRGAHWEKLRNEYSPGKRMKHNLVASSDYIYLFGGYREGSYLNDIWRYKIQNDAWEELVTYGISSIKRQFTLYNNLTVQREVEIENMKPSDSVEYSSNGTKPLPRVSGAMTYFKSTEDYILLFGGMGFRKRLYESGNVSVTLGDFWVFSINTQKWTQVVPFNKGPQSRFEAQITQLDTKRVVLFGGRNQDKIFDDTWVFNLESNQWYEWTEYLKNYSEYPKGRHKASMVKSQKGLVLYGGTYTQEADLELSDAILKEYQSFESKCSQVFEDYGVDISQVGTESFEDRQQQLYDLTQNECFNTSVTVPENTKKVEFVQGVHFLNFSHCPEDCNGNGTCAYSTCFCDTNHFGTTCEHKLCKGSLCIYDEDSWEEKCIECSGNGNCQQGECTCNEGWTREDCSTLQCRECTNCVELGVIGQCDCPGNRGGDSCEVVFCEKGCSGNGECDLTTGKCKCFEGYQGTDCSLKQSNSVGIELSLLLCIFLL